MELFRKQKGQTIIETALILVLLLFILFGISEFARAWYMKNSLKNAVRQGVRVGVVSPDIAPTTTIVYSNCAGNPCPSASVVNNAYIIDAVCCPSGVQNRTFGDPAGGTGVSISYTDDDGSTGFSTGDTVTVTAQTNFQSVVSSRFWPWLQNITITTDASMRYE